MRVYLPSTLSRLAELERTGSLGDPPYPAHAATDALRDWYGEGDEEELEWAASEEAALGSLRLLAADRAAPRRRVVLPADVPDDAVLVDESLGPAGVRVTSPIGLLDIASVHVDSPDAAPLVERAVARLADYDEGDEDAAAVLAALDEQALEWYATQEIADLLRG